MKCNWILLVGLLAATEVLADGFTVSTGVDYSTGKYGSNSSTNVVYAPTSVTYQTGKMTYKVIVPIISVTGDGSVVPSGFGSSGDGSSGSAGAFGCTGDNRKGAKKAEDNGVCASSVTSTTTTTTAKRTTETGLGDVVALATMNIVDNDQWAVDVTGKVKLPTASESRGLGSGKADYAVQADVDRYFGAPFVSAGLGYRVLGEPSGVTYRNVAFGSIGGGYKFSDKATAGVSYDWATASTSRASKPQLVSVYGSYRINEHYKLNTSVYAGLSHASPDVGGGMYLFYGF